MNTPHILVVDDEPGVLDVCARSLRRQGFEVTTASDAKTARILLQSHTVDLLISDMKMPGESGVSLLQAVHETSPDLPLMIITAYPESTYVDAALELNVKAFVPKPFDISVFVHEVKRSLGLRESQPPKTEPDITEFVSVFVEELRRHQVPVLEGTLERDPETGRVILIPENSDGRIPVEDWLLGYTKGMHIYLTVLPHSG
ncbi:MAG: response regulator [Anaerolineae bacterium]|nr:response regulator [Anaerolineae bacterium]